MKKYLFFLIFIAISSYSFSQIAAGAVSEIREFLEYTPMSSSGLTKVEIYKDNTSVMLAQEDGKCYCFYLMTSDSIEISKFVLPEYFSVNDFVILDYVIYFCGMYNGQYGVIGSIQMRKIFDYHTEEFTYKIIYETNSLSKIKAYNEDNIHLACIGTNIGSSGNMSQTDDVVVLCCIGCGDIYYIDYISNQYNYKGHYERNHLQDIEVNDKYIVTIAHYDTALYLPVYDTIIKTKYDTIGTIIDTIHDTISTGNIIDYRGDLNRMIQVRRYERANLGNPTIRTFYMDWGVSNDFYNYLRDGLFLTKRYDHHEMGFVGTITDTNNNVYAFMYTLSTDSLKPNISLLQQPLILDYNNSSIYTNVRDIEYNESTEKLYLLSSIKSDTDNTYKYRVHTLDLMHYNYNTSFWCEPYYNIIEEKPILNNFKLYDNNNYLAVVGISGTGELYTWNQKTDFNSYCMSSGIDNIMPVKKILKRVPVFDGESLNTHTSKWNFDNGCLKILKYITNCIQY
ncbi:MAG: hypothetical protein IJ180_03715 [Bacteroidales bacterium]|nr:hypothetical protein [Bacteroidales bacterium]